MPLPLRAGDAERDLDFASFCTLGDLLFDALLSFLLRLGLSDADLRLLRGTGERLPDAEREELCLRERRFGLTLRLRFLSLLLERLLLLRSRERERLRLRSLLRLRFLSRLRERERERGVLDLDREPRFSRRGERHESSYLHASLPRGVPFANSTVTLSPRMLLPCRSSTASSASL